jgi:epoxyqueuosine reductase
MLQKSNGKELGRNITDYLLENGAISVGIATRETLQDSPPSADITYLMENALSAISFALPINKEYSRLFLSKEDRLSRGRDEGETNIRARELSDALAKMIRGAGHQAIGTSPNYNYRTDTAAILMPEISHRYMAVASGVGSFGWSGNVGIEGYGTSFVLDTTITDAKLEPTAPIPQEDGFCSNCKACVRACPVEMFSLEDETSVTLGGIVYTYAARIALMRCYICCGGDSGLHKSKKWSSWSPGRFEIPEDSDGLTEVFFKTKALRASWPDMDGDYLPVNGYLSADSKIGLPDYISQKLHITCGNCQLVCTGDAKENLENLKALRNSGCVVQYPDGSLKALPGDEAEAEFNRFPPEHRALYC